MRLGGGAWGPGLQGMDDWLPVLGRQQVLESHWVPWEPWAIPWTGDPWAKAPEAHGPLLGGECTLERLRVGGEYSPYSPR